MNMSLSLTNSSDFPILDNLKIIFRVFQATDTRDALAKSIYACLFDWLVEQINKSLAVGKRRTGRSISILDIYGFESFDVCFNYNPVVVLSLSLSLLLHTICLWYTMVSAEEFLWTVLHKLCKWEIAATLQSSSIQVRTRGKILYVLYINMKKNANIKPNRFEQSFILLSSMEHWSALPIICQSKWKPYC
jgi:hypothetical protein